jgi:hypothetical protein
MLSRGSHPNQPQRLRGAESGSGEQARVQRAQIETSVKSVGKCAKISVRIPAEVEGVMTPAQARFEVTKKGVDPLELQHLPDQWWRFTYPSEQRNRTTALHRRPNTLEPLLKQP